MNKKISVIVTSICLVALIVVGSTLAFFTSQGEVNNVITMGNVKITLTEPNYKDSGYVVPGQKIVKDPTVSNVGSHDAYIRCKLEITGEKMDAKNKDLLVKGIQFEDKWALSNDGYYYYQQKLGQNQSARFFNSVIIPQTWDNEFANQNFHINVTAEAIQTDNFSPHTTDGKIIDAWNYSGGGAVSVQP